KRIGEKDPGLCRLILLTDLQPLDIAAERLRVARLGIVLGCLLGRALDQDAALAQIQREGLPGRALLGDAATPARKQIAPSLDGVEIPGVPAQQDASDPPVIVE